MARAHDFEAPIRRTARNENDRHNFQLQLFGLLQAHSLGQKVRHRSIRSGLWALGACVPANARSGRIG